MTEKRYYVEKHKVHGSVGNREIATYWLREKNNIAPLMISSKGYCESICKILNEQNDMIIKLKETLESYHIEYEKTEGELNKMEEDEIFDYKKGIQDLYIILTDDFDGLISQTLRRNNMEHYEFSNDNVEIMECFYDDVRRVYNLIEFHDTLTNITDDEWEFILTDDPNKLDLKYKEKEWLERLRDRINNQLMLDELNEKKILGEEKDESKEVKL